jgi:hypothetical protein
LLSYINNFKNLVLDLKIAYIQISNGLSHALLELDNAGKKYIYDITFDLFFPLTEKS